MQAEHLAIDGSVVSFEVDADVRTGATATGWAIVPSLTRAHPFRVSPPGYSAMVEKTVRDGSMPVRVESVQEFSIKRGTLRVAQVEMPVSTGGMRKLTVGGWEGAAGVSPPRSWDGSAIALSRCSTRCASASGLVDLRSTHPSSPVRVSRRS